MITTLRIDENLKRDCEVVFEDLGLNMTTAINLFLRQVAKQQAIPFALTCSRLRHDPWQDSDSLHLRERGQLAKRFFAEMRELHDEDMPLDEINAEIAAARAERHAQERTTA